VPPISHQVNYETSLMLCGEICRVYNGEKFENLPAFFESTECALIRKMLPFVSYRRLRPKCKTTAEARTVALADSITVDVTEL